MPTTSWHIDVEIDEDDTETRAELTLRMADGGEMHARGLAQRNPSDQPQPRIGEEIATARALSDLTHQLINKAASEISAITHTPATISV